MNTVDGIILLGNKIKIPVARWAGDIVVIAGISWMRLAQERGAATNKERPMPSSEFFLDQWGKSSV